MPNPPDVVSTDPNVLRVFDSIDRSTFSLFFHDFYRGRGLPYTYDFSLITKHALSRIYESYVSILREKASPQLTLFKELPEEQFNKELGGVYTPQFIARFFARFLKENLTPPTFRAVRSIDPACGSGIFLRTLVEMQCDPLQNADVANVTARAFANFAGIDVDKNACDATKLSMHLLHLVLMGRTAPAMRIEQGEAIKWVQEHHNERGTYDAVIANPPFVKWDRLRGVMRSRVRQYMSKYSGGKIDLFLAMVRLGMELVKPGGFLLYVLPHSFLIAKNAQPLRGDICRDYWIRAVVDLSEIPVFESVGSYVVLIVLQRCTDSLGTTPPVTIVRCRGDVGEALQNALERNRVSTDLYDVFEVEQSFFSGSRWQVLPPRQATVAAKLQVHPRLEELVEVKQGLVSGADDIFVVPRREIPKEELSLWPPYLSDREMLAYGTPNNVKACVFFPKLLGRSVTLGKIKNAYPWTYKHLFKHESALRRRMSVADGKNPWWQPVRSRSPLSMFRPKIVSPHLVLKPKFGIDEDGKYAVSHGPYMYPKSEAEPIDLLQYVVAILNSPLGQWQVAALSDKYSRGYAMLEKKTLIDFRIPDPKHVPKELRQRIGRLIRQIGNSTGEPIRMEEATQQLNEVVAELFRLSADEISALGIGV